MWELAALLIYAMQWLGVVLGVGAEAVLLVGHLSALHARKPQWLANIPEVRVVQRWGLMFIVASGIAAVAYQLFNDISVLLIPTFGFKWVLIAVVSLVFWAERWMNRGRGLLEGFAGATWLALFVVHSTAPIFVWEDLFFFYGVWTIFFLALWGSVVWGMKRTQSGDAAVASHSIVGAEQVPAAPMPAPVRMPPPAPKATPKPVVAAAPVPPPPRPVSKPVAPPPPPPPKPQPVAPQPISIAVVRKVEPPKSKVEPEVEIHEEPHKSLWQRFVALFSRTPKPAVAVAPEPVPVVAAAPVAPAAPQPSMASVSAPVAYEPQYKATPAAPAPVAAAPAPVVGATLPVVEHLELMAPAVKPVAAAAPAEPSYVPDYNNAPGVVIMPQKPEDLSKQNRAPIVQPA